jgi:kumamolisin
MPGQARQARTTIAGSEKQPLANATPIGEVDPKERITVTVLLRRRGGAPTVTTTRGGAAAPMAREAFAEQHGADPADVDRLEDFAHTHHLTVDAVDLAARTVKLSGTVGDLIQAFEPELKLYRVGRRKVRGRTGALSAPRDVAAAIEGVFGLDDRPVARPHFRVSPVAPAQARPGRGGEGGAMAPRNAPDGSLTTPEIAKLYDFPADLDGSGQCIAILELGGGFKPADLSAYFTTLKVPKPRVVAVGVDGGRNAPGDPADGEVVLDIEVAGAVAPKATIAVYFAPNTDQGFLDALLAAVHDTRRKPSVVSISWGSPEDVSWTAQARSAFDGALQDAAALGVTVCCAAGDDGSSDIRDPAQRDRTAHADFPASSPWALACGGTKLVGSGTVIQSEVVWNEGNSGGAGGGGVSVAFPPPAYQSGVTVPKAPNGKAGRGVPDVAGNADPRTGYRIMLNGSWSAIGGTSAVAPLWAGLIALLNQRRSALGKPPVGFLHPTLYAHPDAFRDVTEGTNDIDGTLQRYSAGPGWDACTGLGSPIGSKLLAAIGG